MENTIKQLDRLFYPKSIAVVGASKSLSKIGTAILFSIIAGGFKGKIYPINPKENEILGLKTYPSLKEIDEPVDLVIICIQAELVPRVVQESCETGISFGVIISSGFGEVGDAGKNLEIAVLNAAREGGMKIAGPNCMGIVSSNVNLHALLNMLIPKKGDVSVISQSGTIGSLTSVYGSEQGFGINKFISTGNELDLHTDDFIEYLAEDEETKVISVFVEGIKNGKRFFDIAKKASKKKPLVILKGGVSEAGAKAVTSHTGSIAGSSIIYNAAANQTGIIQAYDEMDMIDLIKAFSSLPLPKGRNVGVTGAWGGLGVLTSDECFKRGLNLPELSEASIAELNNVLPPFWSHGNPIDITGSGLGGDFEMLTKPVEVLLRDPNIDGVIWMVPALGSLFDKVIPRMDPAVSGLVSQMALGSMASQEMEMAENMIELKSRYNKPLLAILIGLYGRDGAEHIAFLEENGIPVYESTQKAARVMAKLADYSEYLKRSANN